MAFSIVSAKVPTGDTPICNVTLEPYVLVKRGDLTVTADEVPEEGSPEGNYQLRNRWYRSTIPRGGSICSVHPDKEASVQCLVCLRLRVQQHLSYHCSVDCFKNSWSVHKDLHKQCTPNGQEIGVSKTVNSQSSIDAWIEVGKNRTYAPSLDDVGYILKYEVSVVDKLHPYADLGRGQAVMTAAVRPAPNPPLRALLPLTPGGAVASPGKFTVLTYNLLADLYTKTDQNNQCPAWLLAWQYRKRNLLRELLAYKADILCLQEVQSDHYADFWAPEFQKAGYVPIYKKKTSEMFTSENKYAIDGCATFFRRDRFALVKKYEVEFNKAALSLADSMMNQQNKKQALNRLLKDNVALIAVLEAMDSGTPETSSRRQLICVANTHIHANPELNDVKIWQVHTLLKGLEKIAASADIPMLVAGDFNSVPGSPAHSLLLHGKVDHAVLDQSFDPLNFLKEQKLVHTLPLASAYARVMDANVSSPGDHRLEKQRARLCPKTHEPLFTNISKDFKGTLDYILYTKDSLIPTAILELPAEAEILGTPDETLPNAIYSSDHIALLAEFEYVGRS
jgi:CCR4-NOT transcription complex subunit 6